MKKLKCRDLGGVCIAEITGSSFEEIGKKCHAHVMEQIEKGDGAHQAAADKMKNASSEEQKFMMADFKKRYDEAPNINQIEKELQKITPCLWFDSEAEEASQFYTSVFPDSKILQKEKYNVETPSNKPIGSVMTVGFEIFGHKFLALNGGPYFKPNPSISFHIKCRTKDEVDAIWQKLSLGGSVLMPLDKYVFSERYGWIQDKYGFSWQIILMRETESRRRITPVLMFVKGVCGKAEEAVKFYTSIFKDSSVGNIMRYEKVEEPDNAGTVKYAGFTLAGQDFGAMDSAHDHNFNFNEAISLIINCKDQEEINYFYDKLSVVPDAEICGWIKDKFGVSWQLATTDLEKFVGKKEVMKALLKMKRLHIGELKKIYQNG